MQFKLPTSGAAQSSPTFLYAVSTVSVLSYVLATNFRIVTPHIPRNLDPTHDPEISEH